jgi:hypothetical protein
VRCVCIKTLIFAIFSFLQVVQRGVWNSQSGPIRDMTQIQPEIDELLRHFGSRISPTRNVDVVAAQKAARSSAMHKLSLGPLLSFALIASVTPLLAQTAAIQQTAPCPVIPPKPRALTVEIKTQRVPTLADGTTITTDGKGTMARDSQGRTLNVTTTSVDFRSSRREEITFAYVEDPVAGTESRWDSQSRKATVLKMPADRRGCWVSNSGGHWYFGPPSSKPAQGGAVTSSPRQITVRNTAPLDRSEQDLGTQVIMGVEARGSRTVTTTPAGSEGNDKPIIRINEMWVAPEVPTPLRQITIDPRMGVETREVVSLDLTEPPLSTFEPPDGYEIEIEELHEVSCQE